METFLKKLALPKYSLAAPKNLSCPKFGGGGGRGCIALRPVRLCTVI